MLRSFVFLSFALVFVFSDSGFARPRPVPQRAAPKKPSASDRFDNLDSIFPGEQILFQVLKERDPELLEEALVRLKKRFASLKQNFDINALRFVVPGGQGGSEVQLTIADFFSQHPCAANLRILLREGVDFSASGTDSPIYKQLMAAGEFRAVLPLVAKFLNQKLNLSLPHADGITAWLNELGKIPPSDDYSRYSVIDLAKYHLRSAWRQGLQSLAFGLLRGEVLMVDFKAQVLAAIEWRLVLTAERQQPIQELLDGLGRFADRLPAKEEKIDSGLRDEILLGRGPDHVLYEALLREFIMIGQFEIVDSDFLKDSNFRIYARDVADSFCAAAMTSKNLKDLRYAFTERANIPPDENDSNRTYMDFMVGLILDVIKANVGEGLSIESERILEELNPAFERLKWRSADSSFFSSLIDFAVQGFLVNRKWPIAVDRVDWLLKHPPELEAHAMASRDLTLAVRELELEEGAHFKISKLQNKFENNKAFNSILNEYGDEFLVALFGADMVVNSRPHLVKILGYAFTQNNTKLAVDAIRSHLGVHPELLDLPGSQKVRFQGLIRDLSVDQQEVSWFQLGMFLEQPYSVLNDLEAILVAKGEEAALKYLEENRTEIRETIQHYVKQIWIDANRSHNKSRVFVSLLLRAARENRTALFFKLLGLLEPKTMVFRLDLDSQQNADGVSMSESFVFLDAVALSVLTGNEAIYKQLKDDGLVVKDPTEPASFRWVLTWFEAAHLVGNDALVKDFASLEGSKLFPHLSWDVDGLHTSENGQTVFDSADDYLLRVRDLLALFGQENFKVLSKADWIAREKPLERFSIDDTSQTDGQGF